MVTDFNTIISEAASKRTTEKQAEELTQLVVFKLDNEEYAIPITDLREIIQIPDIAPVPNSPEFIRGILNLRGTIVVVIDLEKRFHLNRVGDSKAIHIIITEVSGTTFGLVVDKVNEVLRVPASKIHPSPALMSSKINADYLRGVAVLGEEKSTENIEQNSRLIIILDLPKMLSEQELLSVGTAVGVAVRHE